MCVCVCVWGVIDASWGTEGMGDTRTIETNWKEKGGSDRRVAKREWLTGRETDWRGGRWSDRVQICFRFQIKWERVQRIGRALSDLQIKLGVFGTEKARCEAKSALDNGWPHIKEQLDLSGLWEDVQQSHSPTLKIHPTTRRVPTEFICSEALRWLTSWPLRVLP